MYIINIAGVIVMVSVDAPDAVSDTPTLSSATPPATLLVVPGGPGLGQLLWARVFCPCP